MEDTDQTPRHKTGGRTQIIWPLDQANPSLFVAIEDDEIPLFPDDLLEAIARYGMGHVEDLLTRPGHSFSGEYCDVAYREWRP